MSKPEAIFQKDVLGPCRIETKTMTIIFNI